MRLIGTIFLTIILSLTQAPRVNAVTPIKEIIIDTKHSYTDQQKSSEKESIIIEVEGDPKERQQYIELYHPFIDVVATYDKLFNGLALQATPKRLAKMASLEFVKSVHPVREYQVQESKTDFEKLENVVLPSALNNTSYTGKGIKVAVIDTGIDYNHPDLKNNYVGGYDLVDLDDDPMETVAKQGIPTLHGTHVAGIIAADGKLKGVAPDAEIYAYRALGPGGFGTSIQVIAAMEQAVEDGVDIMNLSLGNSVNGPDFPTSMAVNRASELGIAVVIANGNSGPEKWTVGSPATATRAISVGALAQAEKVPYLYEALENKKIPITEMIGSQPWGLRQSLEIINMDKHANNIRGKIAITKRSDTTFYDKAKAAEEKGAVALLIYNNEEGSFQGSVENKAYPIKIPVVSISKKNGKWLEKQLKATKVYMNTKFHETKTTIAPFSSRGPVTVNWEIKPDILAPGTNILSTVPGGYQKLQGTSMAAPHVAGVIALLKEARPRWTNDQIIGALKTTAVQLEGENKQRLDPIVQGIGHIQAEKAMNTSTIIHDPLLSFGKMDDFKEKKVVELTVENLSNDTQQYHFDIPIKERGIEWKLPQSFTLAKREKVTIPIELGIIPSFLEEGIHQGWLSLSSDDEDYQLPYLFINKTADFPITMGFEFALKSFSENMYTYRLYVTEDVKEISVHLYDPDTLMYEQPLFEITKPKVGLNEGQVKKSVLEGPGQYKVLITVQLKNGEFVSAESELHIE